MATGRKTIVSFVAAAALVVGTGAAAYADGVSYTIPDIGTFAGYTTPDVGQSYGGATGFVGLYGPSSGSDNHFAHLFGVEETDYSRVALQVDITGLAGATINSAYLTFDLLHFGTGPQDVEVTSFSADGDLYYFWTPPDDLGSVTDTVDTGPNSVDVTGLLASRVAGNADWFGLHLQGLIDGRFLWTYTHAGFGYGPDEATVRLVVDYTPGVVPEPATIILLGMGTAGMALRTVRRRISG